MNAPSLFLDRDGVINQLRPNDYVTSPDQLIVLPGVAEALAICRKYFQHIFIVTNQQGIGKHLMTEDDLTAIHQHMTSLIGPIDRIYHCPNLVSDHSFRRKPNIGMAIQAKHDFPDLQLSQCLMVGDTYTDMLFGRRAKMKTVLIADDNSLACTYPHLVDFHFRTLIDFANLYVAPLLGGH